LLPHQVEAVTYSNDKRAALYYLKPGTGKTLIGLTLGGQGKTAFIVPASLTANWVTENEKFGVLKNFSWWNPSKKLAEKPTESFVCSYDAFQKLTVADLKEFKTFVFDESHKLKSTESKRTKAVFSIVSRLKPKVFMLSGTPFTTSISDAYSQYLLLDSVTRDKPLKNADEFYSLSSFKEHFMKLVNIREVQTKTGKRVKIPEYAGFINQDRFFELTNPYTFRKEIELNLPQLNHQIIRVEAEKVPREVDNQLEELAVSLGKDPTNFQTSRKLSAVAKAKVFAEFLADYRESSDNPVVGFSCFPDVLVVAKNVLEKMKLKVAVLNADTSMSNRGKIAGEFQEGKFDILLCSLLVAREGFTLTKANTVIFNDISPVASDNEQASKRIHRIGQIKDCRVIYLARSRIDARLTELCTQKRDVMQVLDKGVSDE